MIVRQGTWDTDAAVDVLQLEQEFDYPALHVFIDTIDDVNEIRHFEEDGGEFLIIRIPRTEYNLQEDQYAFVKQKIIEALQRLELAA